MKSFSRPNHRLVIISLLAALSGLPLFGGAQTAQPTHAGTVLLVVSGAGRDSGSTRPGFEMDELSQAYLIFKDNGFTVAIASPAGGAVEADRFNRAAAYNASFVADAEAMRQLGNTQSTAGLRARDFAAVFVVGGKGAMFDLPLDTALARLVGEIHDQGGVVSAVCHGPAGLVGARTRDGTSLVAGRAVTGLTNEEEMVFGKKWLPEFPFLLEDELRRLGARWEEVPLMLPHVAVDGRLITGQNPFATAATAEAVVRALGRTPVARVPWKEERTVNFAAGSLRADPLIAKRELAVSYKELQVELIGLLGYYHLQAAQDLTAVRSALSLLELAAPYMPEPNITLALADAYYRLGRVDEARTLASEVVRTHPAMDEARTLLARIRN